MDYNFCVPCLLGLEGPISDELRRLDIPGVRAENGRVYFTGGGEGLARANINLPHRRAHTARGRRLHCTQL